MDESHLLFRGEHSSQSENIIKVLLR